MSDIFQGIFWVICGCGDGMFPDLQDFELLSFKVPCDATGEVLNHNMSLKLNSDDYRRLLGTVFVEADTTIIGALAEIEIANA